MRGDVEDWLASLAKQHIATEMKERKGFHFSVLKNSWLVGFSDQALLVMGTSCSRCAGPAPAADGEISEG